MSTLFAEDFRAEEARFAAAIPSSDARSTPGTPGDSQKRPT